MMAVFKYNMIKLLSSLVTQLHDWIMLELKSLLYFSKTIPKIYLVSKFCMRSNG